VAVAEGTVVDVVGTAADVVAATAVAMVVATVR